MTERYKLVIVGDGNCGKTCLLTVFYKNDFSEKHLPTIFETSVSTITVNDKEVLLELWDTAGQEEYDSLRPLSYVRCHVVILCFSFDCPSSLINVAERWKPEITHYLPRVPIILVGTKTDLVNNRQVIANLDKDGEKPVTSEEGRKMAERIGACAYLECSSKTKEGVHTVFETATKSAMSFCHQKPAKRCPLL